MRIRHAFLACVALAVTIVAGEERLLKPVAGPGAGQPVDGLRASVAMVKSDFGPGESLLVVWQLTNESGRPVELSIDKRNWYDFAFEVRRDGSRLETPRASAKRRPDNAGKLVTLEPGQAVKQFIDLRALDWVDAKWADPRGTYDVSAIYTPKRLQSGWTQFKIVPVEEKLAPPPPNQTERIRGLIAQLGSDEFATRDAAYQQLLDIGRPALPFLQEIVATGGDTEPVARCRRLIADIQRKLNPPPPPPPPQPPPPPPPPPPPEEF